MASPKQTITCPFCFDIFKLANAVYRCANVRCKREIDQIYQDKRGLKVAPAMGHVFAAPSRRTSFGWFKNTSLAKCDLCAVESKKRLCPICHFELSHDVGEIDDHVIAIIGARETGKGHYITTLINRLENEVGTQFNFSLRMLGDDTRKRFEEDYRTPLLRRKEMLQPTQSAAVDSRVKSPMVFRLTPKNRSQAINLSFFDSAGEDMQSLDMLSSEARYICSASGIIFLLDPLQIDAVRGQLSPDILPVRDYTAEPVYIVERLRELFERRLGISANTMIKTPVAFVLSKIDTLLPIIEPGSALHLTGEHFGSFNLTDAQSVHTEIRNYLDSWMGSGISNRVEAEFGQHAFFGVSSFGRTPESGRLETISPIRVEDPFLWLLYQLGMIKGKKDGKR